MNGEVFNALGAKIRGKSKLPKGRRTICFSPHPDDDVISMGGILRKFVENGNEVHVAYMTSGNIAVFDHEVRKYVDFLRRLEHDRGIGGSDVDVLADKVYGFLDSKHPGDVDIPEVQDIKRIIRESEAVAGIEVMGLTRDNARFLNLPFYQTGKVKKDPIGPEDVAIVRESARGVQAGIIFVAGDLSDPHGTHRVCKEAIDRCAICKDITFGATSEVWLYRGAWQEWPHGGDMAVPLSQEELRQKIQAIFKHQSQKDSALFPGGRRTRVLAARRCAQSGHGRAARSSRPRGVLRDGSVRRRVATNHDALHSAGRRRAVAVSGRHDGARSLRRP